MFIETHWKKIVSKLGIAKLSNVNYWSTVTDMKTRKHHMEVENHVPLWRSPVTVPSPGGAPSWSRHFQSMPRTTRAPWFMCFRTCDRIWRRCLRRFASASRTALPTTKHIWHIKYQLSKNKNVQTHNCCENLPRMIQPRFIECLGPDSRKLMRSQT